MRAFLLALTAAAALISLPAQAAHWHFGHHHHAHSHVSVGLSYGYPFGYGFYGPRYYPWYGYGPAVGVQVSPRRAARSERTGGEQGALKMYVYPAAGQTSEQTAEDRYQCHVWAADQSGYDPTLGAGKRDEAESYTRAFTACMEGRDYVVK